jgi:hypothetical protein
MWPGPCHRHGFAVLINGAGRIATMQLAFVCSLSVVWGCQRAGEYAIKGRLIYATQPWFAFLGRMRFFRVIFSIRRSIVGTTVLQAAAVQQLLCP